MEKESIRQFFEAIRDNLMELSIRLVMEMCDCHTLGLRVVCGGRSPSTRLEGYRCIFPGDGVLEECCSRKPWTEVSLCGRAIQSNQILKYGLFMSGVPEEYDYCRKRCLEKEKLVSAVAVPLARKDGARGLFLLGYRTEKVPETERLVSVQNYGNRMLEILSCVDCLCRKKTGSVLIVDDEPSVLSIFSRYFERENYFARTALNVEKALEEIENIRFDLVITDYQMGDATGLELAQTIHDRLGVYSPRIILISGYLDEPDAETMKKAGIAKFYRKPIADMRFFMQDIFQDTA